MAKRLPFKTEPKTKTVEVGNEETGVLVFPQLGGLKVAEQAAMDAVSRELPNAFAEASSLAVRIQQEQKISDLVFCFEIVANPAWEVQAQDELTKLTLKPTELKKKQEELDEKIKQFNDARIRYAPDIIALNNRTEQGSSEKKVSAVTAIIKYRLDPEWEEADTKELESKLFDEIWKFAETEMNGGEELKPSTVDSETVGKPLEENSTSTTPIGEKSSGESKTTSPTTKDSTTKTLATAQAG